MGALQYVDVPGYAALILRRTLPQLARPDGLLPRSHEWLGGTGARWQEQQRGELPAKTWIFPSGATLTFGYLQHENDKYEYQGAAYQYIAFDELTQFRSTQYKYMFSRLVRKAGVDIPLRMRSTSNPGGTGHEWVKLRFVSPRCPERPFIPARVDDNPHIDQVAYRESLAELDPVERAQLERGDWEVTSEGKLFPKSWPVVEPEQIPAGCLWVRFWDTAATEVSNENPDPDWTVGTLMGTLPGSDPRFWIADVQRDQCGPAGVEELMQNTAAMDGREVDVAIEQEPGASGKVAIDHYQAVLKGYAVYGRRATGDPLVRVRPYSAAATNKKIALVRAPWNPLFIAEHKAFPSEGVHDDSVIAGAGAHTHLCEGPDYGDLAGMTIGGDRRTSEHRL